MPLEAGKRLGQYEIHAPLGAGGMGEVYRARDTKLGRDVAIKVLPEHFAEDQDRMARFEREARVLASLNHPNIAAVYGLGESEGSHYLVMELVPGEILAAKIQKGRLSVDNVLKIARQLIDALEAAHDNGVVHRDLKPANIQITPDGNHVAYVSNESGRDEVYVQRFPELGDKRPISNGGGTEPVWARDGETLFYRSPTHLMAVDVRLGPSLELRAAQPVMEDTFYAPGNDHTYYDVMPDGRFVILDARDATARTYVNVVVNWSEELAARLPR